jgi:starch-binding outer membrane protein SusE/F
MKKIFSYALMMIATMVAFTSCESDQDSNPTLVTPTEFTVNNPSVGDALVDLAKSESVQLSWSQPKFTTMNAPLTVQYQVQLSTTGNFTKQYYDESDDNASADFIAIDETSTSCKVDVPTKDIAKCLQKLTRWAEDAVPAEQKVSVRIRAFVANASMETLSEVCSNVISFNAVPYYVELKDAVPTMWYLVGNMFGGKWGSDIGVDALPMFLIPDYDYDKKTGAGEIEYTNYFLTGDYNSSAENGEAGFKIQRADFNWDYSMNADGATKGTIINRNGGADGGHIVASEAGYYTITLNTADNTAKMVKYEGEVKDYGTIQITGSFNGWVDAPMLPYNTEGVENHAWYYVMDVPAGDPIQFKFKIEGSWETNWGYGAADGDINMYGKCDAGGKNIGLAEGKYVISFNDITGSFSIVKL